MCQQRATRLSLPQRLTRWADELRRWLDTEHKEAFAEKPTVKQRPTLREQVQRTIEQIHQQHNRPSRGLKI